MNTQDIINDQFVNACNLGDLEKVRSCLLSPDITIHAQIHYDNDLGLRQACFRGHLPIIQFLLTSPYLNEHARIHAHNDSPIILSAKHNHLELFIYLLTSEDLTEHANIHANNDEAFQWACRNNNRKIIEYFITHFYFPATNQPLQSFLKQYSTYDGVIYALYLLSLQQLYHDLSNHLEHKKDEDTFIKI